MITIKLGIWYLGIAAFTFGLTDRTYAAFADGHVLSLDLALWFTAASVFVGWLFLRPNIE